MMRLRYLARLFSDVVVYCVLYRTLWPLVILLLFIVLGASVGATQVALPYIYTIF